MISRWTEEQKIKALTIAEAISITEAARQTGIPAGTIKRWRSEANRAEPGELSEPSRIPKKLERLQQSAIERAVDQAGSYIADRLKGLADDLYDLAAKAMAKVDIAISDPEELPAEKKGEPHDRDGSAWVRALIGVMAQAIDKAQLLSGKPTSRQALEGEMKQTYEHHYHIIQELVNSNPELVDAIFGRCAAEGRGAGQP